MALTVGSSTVNTSISIGLRTFNDFWGQSVRVGPVLNDHVEMRHAEADRAVHADRGGHKVSGAAYLIASVD